MNRDLNGVIQLEWLLFKFLFKLRIATFRAIELVLEYELEQTSFKLNNSIQVSIQLEWILFKFLFKFRFRFWQKQIPLSNPYPLAPPIPGTFPYKWIFNLNNFYSSSYSSWEQLPIERLNQNLNRNLNRIHSSWIETWRRGFESHRCHHVVQSACTSRMNVALDLCFD